MKVTDYSKIADKYDENQYRVEEVKFDLDIKKYINDNPKPKYNVLDLACGTGIYLDKQIRFFKDFNIDWNGLDASSEMLKKAKGKLENVAFVQGLAEEMPYETERFDYIANNYAFHHFTNKEKALDEISRIIKKNGIFKLHNIAIHDMPNWWVYHYFPSAYHEDLNRFWQKDVIFNELSKRGFKVNIQIVYLMKNVMLSDYIGYAENRDISILTLIDNKEYQEGLERMREDLQNNPNKIIVNDFTEMFCRAQRI